MTKKRRRYWFTPALDRNYYPAIGHAIVLWAFLEIEIDSHIKSLLSRPLVSSHIKAGAIDSRLPRPFKKRVTTWRRLITICFSDADLATISDIVTRCAALRDARDRIAHCRWVGGYEGKYWREEEIYFAQLYKDGIQKDAVPMTIDEIRDTTLEISALIRELMIFQYHPSPWATLFSKSAQ